MGHPQLEEQGAGKAERTVADARLRLYDLASELRPLPTNDELRQRIQGVLSQMRSIEHDLILAQHISDLEDGGLEDEAADLDRRLGEGWVPASRPVEDVVAGLRVGR